MNGTVNRCYTIPLSSHFLIHSLVNSATHLLPKFTTSMITNDWSILYCYAAILLYVRNKIYHKGLRNMEKHTTTHLFCSKSWEQINRHLSHNVRHSLFTQVPPNKFQSTNTLSFLISFSMLQNLHVKGKPLSKSVKLFAVKIPLNN